MKVRWALEGAACAMPYAVASTVIWPDTMPWYGWAGIVVWVIPWALLLSCLEGKREHASRYTWPEDR